MRYHRNCLERVPALSAENAQRLNHLDLGGPDGVTEAASARFETGRERLALRGSGCVFSVTLRVPAGCDLTGIRCAVCCDGSAEAQVDCSLADFFLVGWEGHDYSGEYSGKRTGNHEMTLYRNVDIPYRNGCVFTLRSAGGGRDLSGAALTLLYKRTDRPLPLGRCAQLRAVGNIGQSSEWAEEILLADIDGAGVMESIQFSMRNPDTAGRFMEGNFEFYIDGNDFPEYQSTGTEEFFMGGVYFANLHECAFSGCTRTFNDGAPNENHTVSAHRLFKEDKISWDRRLKIVWHNGQIGQGAVTGTTSYDFCAMYFQNAPLNAEGPLPSLRNALKRLDRLDCRAVCGGRTRGGVSAVAEETELVIPGPAALELLSLHGESDFTDEAWQDAEIVFDLDGDETAVPCALLFSCRPSLRGDAGRLGGATAGDSCFRALCVHIQKRAAIRYRGSVPASLYAEYREADTPGDIVTRLVRGRFTARDRQPEVISGSDGYVDSAALQTSPPNAECFLEWYDRDRKPVGALSLRDFLRVPEYGYASGFVTDESVYLPRENDLSAVRAFLPQRFVYRNGLALRVGGAADTAFFLILQEQRGETGTQDSGLSAVSARRRLNRLDNCENACEPRCYNPIEGAEPEIMPVAPGQTVTAFEDRGAGMLTGIRLGTPGKGDALHQSRLRVFTEDQPEPVIDTTCARFFSAEYDDPLFWSHTGRLMRPSKKQWDDGGRHSSMLRMIRVPYTESIRVELQTPPDRPLDGFDNVYWASARRDAAEMNGEDGMKMISETLLIAPGEEKTLAGHTGACMITSVQIMAESAASAFRRGILRLFDGEEELIRVPLWRFFMGTPENAPCLHANYLPAWKTVLERQEGYFTTADIGYVRYGRQSPCRDVMYRLLDDRPLTGKSGLRVTLSNAGDAPVRLDSDILFRFPAK